MDQFNAARRSFPALGLALLAATGLAAPASAQNLVTNPGFETGDFSGWTATRAASGSFLGVGGVHYAASGNYGAYFGAVGAQADSITQFLPTVAGDDSASFPYTRYSFTAAATGTSTALSFAGRQVPNFFGLDDISVTDLGAAPVPESSTTVSFGLMLALGLGALVVAAKRRKAAPGF